MHDIRARIRVDVEHNITGVAPAEVPPGDHEVTITLVQAPVRQPAKRPFDVNDLPSHDLGAWPEGLSLHREDMYGEDGR